MHFHTPLTRLTRRIALLLLPLGLMTGCGGSDNGGGSGPQSDDTRLNGTLVVPESGELSAASLLLPPGLEIGLRSDACPAVPEGYAPLADAQIRFLDDSGNEIGESIRSDACGGFSASMPEGAAELVAEAAGYRPISNDVTFFIADAASPAVASTVDADAEYRIGALQVLDDGRIAFTVTDTLSNQTVLGIPDEAVAVTLDGADAPLTALGYSASESDAATALLILDSSGSMAAEAWIDPDTGELWRRRDLVSLAAHRFIDQKSSNDAAGFLIFSTSSFVIEEDLVNTLLPLSDAAGNPVDFPYPASGFTTDPLPLHFIADAYNDGSDLWGRSMPRHVSLDEDMVIDAPYPFSGLTSLYVAILDGLDMLEQQSASRPVIIAMTDGRNNGGSSVSVVVQAALAANTPVYTIGMSDAARSDSLIEIALDTGGTYYQVESTDISGAYQSIQTGIVFQYIGALSAASDATAASRIELSLDYNGLQTTRELVIAPDVAATARQ